MMPEFTPSQQLRMAFLAGRYATAEEIAADRAIGATASAVRFFLDRAGFPPPPSETARANLRLEIQRSLVNALDDAANARRFGRCEMAEKILETVLASQLVGAVMNDGMA